MNVPVSENLSLSASARAGLSEPQKKLEAKWFYDQQGSALFEQITVLPEYYPTRTELSILHEQVSALGALFPAGSALVELGSGASTKTRLLLSEIAHIDSYVPCDISGEFLRSTAATLAKDFPSINIEPIVADFMQPVEFTTDTVNLPKVAFFPGSTIGNLEKNAAIDLMARIRRWPQVKGFVLGVDLIKNADRLIAAYDDDARVTAAFNKNILTRMNREAGGTFDISAFRHEARWNEAETRVEMHLVAVEKTQFSVDGQAFYMAAGESIHTENSHKYSRDQVARLAHASGWKVKEFFTDINDDFGVVFLEPIE